MAASKRWMLLPLLALMCVGGVGCESDNDDRDRDRDRDRLSRRERERLRDRDDRVISRSPDVDRDADVVVDVDRRDPDRGFDMIPRRAVRIRVIEGNQEVTYTPDRDGTIYVYDVEADEVVYDGRVRRGEVFLIDPDDNKATIDGRTVLREDLKSSHRFRIYFAVD